MSAERCRAATQDRVQYFQVQPGKPLLAALEEALSGCADHVSHLDGRPGHLLRIGACPAFPRQRQRVERAGGGVQVLLRKVEINRGLFQVAMAQQNLDSPQIRAIFEQMSGEAVSNLAAKLFSLSQAMANDWQAFARALWRKNVRARPKIAAGDTRCPVMH
jgi:hypothetical protein